MVSLTIHAESTADLIASAIKINPEIQFYEAEITAAKAGKRSTGQLTSPDLALSAGGKTIRAVGDGPVWRAELSQNFEFPGRVALRKAIADRDIALAELGLMQFKSLLGNDIRARAGEIALMQRQAEATRGVHQRLASLIQVLVQRDTGTVSAKLERRILEATLLTTDRALTDAEKSLTEATTRINLIAGRSPSATLSLADATATFPDVPTLEALKTQSAKANFDLAQKRVQLARQGLQIDLTKSERWSNITFGPYIGGESAGDHEIEGGISLSIPLPLWNGKLKADVEAGQARQQGAQAMLNATLRQLENELTVARASYAAELEALTHWHTKAEAEFQQAAAEADQHYRLGAVPATTYVEMQRGYLEALDALVQTRRNAWQHRMEIERLTGTSLEVKP